MWKAVLYTSDDRLATVVRIALGVVMLPHGLQKVLPVLGGFGPAATIEFFQQAWGIAPVVTALVIAAEFLGALGLISGFLTRVSAAGIAAVMTGAVVIQHAAFGFFMNWTGQQGGEGYEYHILAIALAVVVMIRGGGWASVDGVIARQLAASRVRA